MTISGQVEPRGVLMIDDSLTRTLLEILSVDYENVSTISMDITVNGPAPAKHEEEILPALHRLIDFDFVDCYVFSFDLNEYIKTDFDSSKVDDYYFFISSSGKEYLRNLEGPAVSD